MKLSRQFEVLIKPFSELVFHDNLDIFYMLCSSNLIQFNIHKLLLKIVLALLRSYFLSIEYKNI